MNASHAGDSIVALATPPGVSGIAVIRISGGDAIERTAPFFRGRDLRAAASHTVHFGALVDADGAIIDQVLATVFRAPHSYTGEDCVEFSCHGGTAASRAVVARLLEAGLRHAEPGEFTRRAFLNGRMDLVQAEAVADLIHAETEDARRASLQQLEGALSHHVAALRDRLIRCTSLLELSLDFAEEDVPVLSRTELIEELDAVRVAVLTALESHRSGRVIREGFRIALAGRPNAGKSSVLNALLGTDRAIVTGQPGTTRDYIEESAVLRGTLVRFVDTAGLRASDDEVERLGIQRSEHIIREADCVCHIIDTAGLNTAGLNTAGLNTAGLNTAGLESAAEMHAALGAADAPLFVLNKIDLLDARRRAALPTSENIIRMSAITGEGLTDLVEALAQRARAAILPATQSAVLVTSARHAACLRRTLDAVMRAREAVLAGRTEEYVAADLRAAIEAAGDVIGIVRTDDVLDAIFSRFCIGK